MLVYRGVEHVPSKPEISSNSYDYACLFGDAFIVHHSQRVGFDEPDHSSSFSTLLFFFTISNKGGLGVRFLKDSLIKRGVSRTLVDPPLLFFHDF